jgi:hypothetical protein
MILLQTKMFKMVELFFPDHSDPRDGPRVRRGRTLRLPRRNVQRSRVLAVAEGAVPAALREAFAQKNLEKNQK